MTLIESFMARREPRVLTLQQSGKKRRVPLQLSYKIAQGSLTASCKRLISWFLLDKGTELSHKIVPVRPPKFEKSKRKEVGCIFKANGKIRVNAFGITFQEEANHSEG
ncbi:hypothetical protein TNCV_2473101 [Trichonephila clavipes]|nr:hypothetical protein TNCV_2473101 [Trichonephila clavipes]